MPRNEEQPSCDWQPCEEGELVRLAKRLERRRLIRQIASGGFKALLLAVPISYLAWRGWREADRHYGGIGCREMLSLLHTYEKGGLAAGKRAQVRAHLAKCGNCWLMQKYREAQSEHTPV